MIRSGSHPVPPPRRRWRCWALATALSAAACSAPDDDTVEVRVRYVAIDPATRSPVVVLEDPSRERAMPIWIGPAEAQSIAAHLGEAAPARPLTHDLIKNMFEQLGVALRRVVIRDLQDNTYLADIVIDRDGEELVIDSRPSDAIALAVRFGQPILVREGLFTREAVVDVRDGDASATVAGVTVQPLSAELARFFDLPPGRGVLVSDVAEVAAALRRGDVILEVDGAAVLGVADFRAKLRTAGGSAALSVQRDGDRVEVGLARRDEPAE